jgi:hypothetical protein
MSRRSADASTSLALCPECQRLLDACLVALTKYIEIGDAVTVDDACWNGADYEAAVLALNRHRKEHGCKKLS